LVKCKGSSLPLQRVITDFGADSSYGETIKKIKEHYGIEISFFTVQKVTRKHAQQFILFKSQTTSKKQTTIISQTDGSMVPIIETEGKAKDKRKNRKAIWKEARLSFARGKDENQRYYAGIIGSAEKAGEKMMECALLAGMKEGTYVHGVIDGAPWIGEQFKLKFSNRGNYLIDFFHMCEYLSKASIWFSISEKDKWQKEAQEKLKTGRHKELFEEIKSRIDNLEVKDASSGIIECYHYMEKRLEHINYKIALDKGLPIGSGEIESSHRSVIQKRLKIAGAWWKVENANAMLHLRINRFNGYWEEYWQLQRAVA